MSFQAPSAEGDPKGHTIWGIHMKPSVKIVQLAFPSLVALGLLLLCASAGNAQGPGRRAPRTQPRRDSAFTIITKVPFRGQYYYIKIIPLDTGNRDHMPILNPNRRNTLLWRDSLQHLLPDSILQYLERQKPKP